MKNIFKTRFSLLFSFLITYLSFSFFIRLSFYFLSIKSIDFSVLKLLETFLVGLFFDIGVALFFSGIYALYLLLFPAKFIGSLVDKCITFFIVGLLLFIAIFASMAEYPFWSEFSTRFNFIAVDYLIYTYEVLENIQESYPIALILFCLFAILFSLLFFYKKQGIFLATFSQKPVFKTRAAFILPLLFSTFLYVYFIKNKQAEWSTNLYENELSKNGVFSFFAAYRSNELDYNTFYTKLPLKDAYTVLKKELIQPNAQFTNTQYDNIERAVNGTNTQKPNIIMIAIESFSADFLNRFGNKQNLTPFYDSLAKESIFFTNLYATGTRTVRGMEALTLCIPPTPGNSIVRRPNNDKLYSIATVLKEKNYHLNFIYGGDGYFDNMNTFFGGQGFDIVDRDRGNPLSENIITTRFPIKDKEVTFENAWGICDEDIYTQSLHFANTAAETKTPFFQFVMTTSNHKPYSFAKNKINMPQGNREGAVKYTDYALSQFIKKASAADWYANTIFVIVADHCANSAGKWEINIDKHHIPAIIFNCNHQKIEVNKLVSQIDIMPTLFGLLHWQYNTKLYGKDITLMQPNEERALLGNYRTLGLLKNNIFTQLNDRNNVIQFNWNNTTKTMVQLNTPIIDSLKNTTIAYYQTASERFKDGKMKQ